MTGYICPDCKRETVKVLHRKPCADCYLIKHRESDRRYWARKVAGKPPPAPSGKGWDSSRANELLMRKL